MLNVCSCPDNSFPSQFLREKIIQGENLGGGDAMRISLRTSYTHERSQHSLLWAIVVGGMGTSCAGGSLKAYRDSSGGITTYGDLLLYQLQSFSNNVLAGRRGQQRFTCCEYKCGVINMNSIPVILHSCLILVVGWNAASNSKE